MIRHVFRSHYVERWEPSKRSYGWRVGYCEALPNGGTSIPPTTRKEWYNLARRDRFIVRFYDNEQDARIAIAR
jgi:hypothetical protein